MSKAIYVCHRKSISPSDIKKIEKVCNLLAPDHLANSLPLIFSSEKIVYGVVNPISTILTKDTSVLLGALYEKKDDWFVPGKESPDGNYAIFRANNKILEVKTDSLSTRSIWYFFDSDIFIASTSQRAIIQFLGNFIFNEQIVPWVISTGSLGPLHNWDTRIKKIPADGAVVLDRDKWNIRTISNPVKFSLQEFSDKQQEKLLEEKFEEVFSSLNIDWKRWAITLSGGYDSRAILLLFKKYGNTLRQKIQTLTWGEKNSLWDKESDGFIAAKLAKKVGTDHNYLSTELSEEPVETILNRFLENGEGRIDHLSGYLDGFLIWKNLSKNNFEGVIRGDEVFGYSKYYNPLQVRKLMGLTICSEFDNLKKYPYITSLHQEIPEYLLQQPEETLSTWRDRLYQMYRVPFIISALSDLKLPYVEQINPFLSNKIVKITRKLPDHLRTDKFLFKKIMGNYKTGIPYAKRGSNGLMINILRQPEIVEIIKQELSSENAAEIFPQDFLDQVIKNLKTENKLVKVKSKSIMEIARNSLPVNFKKFLSRKKTSLILDENTLGFRLFIICRMNKILNPLDNSQPSSNKTKLTAKIAKVI